MGVSIERGEGDLRVLRITGLLGQSEWSAAQTNEAKAWGPTIHIKVLVIAKGFQGLGAKR
jgi:hypothetical protein